MSHDSVIVKKSQIANLRQIDPNSMNCGTVNKLWIVWREFASSNASAIKHLILLNNLLCGITILIVSRPTIHCIVALVFSVAMFNFTDFCLFDWTLTVINLAFACFVYSNGQIYCGSCIGATCLASFFILAINFFKSFLADCFFSFALIVKFYLKKSS